MVKVKLPKKPPKIPKIPKIPKKPKAKPKASRPKTPPGRTKPGPKTANPANAPVTQSFAKTTKTKAFKNMSGAEKTASIKQYWGNKAAAQRKARKRTKGISQPYRGKAFKAAHLYGMGDKEGAFKIYRAMMREGRRKKPPLKPKPKPKKGK